MLDNNLKINTESVISVVPIPMSVECSSGVFVLNTDTNIYIDSNSVELSKVANYLAELAKAPTGYDISILEASKSSKPANAIILTLSGVDEEFVAEGYELTVTPESIIIRASQPVGLFYGVQTLRQLFPTDFEKPAKVDGTIWQVPCVYIKDAPRYKWRGMMLDASRHFISVDTVKRYIDLIALHKMNVLHFHLTDDQGWRIEIKKHPKLTEVGAWRIEEDGTRYGGFYTHDQIRELVEYAKERFVTVVPEIEMPGHSSATIASYPELSCAGEPIAVPYATGILHGVFCAGNEKTFQLLEDVLSEVAELFPGKYLHVGGDECPKDNWRKCFKCQARIKNEGLKDELELQSYFIKRAEKMVSSNGKVLIGWDEILEGGLASGATVMSWNGTKGGIKAAQEGHDVIMCPTSHCYFDYEQVTGAPIENVYSFEPTPDDLSDEQAKHILGSQGNLWSERIKDQDRLDYMAFPRSCALAEVLWSQKELRNWEDFSERMKSHYCRLANIGVNYYVPES